MAENWLTTEQAAELTNYHPDHIRRIIRAGKVKARKFGPVWQVSESSLLTYLRNAEKMGERRGPKRET